MRDLSSLSRDQTLPDTQWMGRRVPCSVCGQKAPWSSALLAVSSQAGSVRGVFEQAVGRLGLEFEFSVLNSIWTHPRSLVLPSNIL